MVIAQPVIAEREVKCCMCFDPKCGITTLLILEILYLIGFVIMIALMIIAGLIEADIASSNA